MYKSISKLCYFKDCWLQKADVLDFDFKKEPKGMAGQKNLKSRSMVVSYLKNSIL